MLLSHQQTESAQTPEMVVNMAASTAGAPQVPDGPSQAPNKAPKQPMWNL